MVFVYGCASSSHGSPGNNIQGQAVPGNTGINQGNLAPDFTINTIDGKTVSLSSLTADKPTVLYFFATWCPHCRNDLSAVSKVYSQYSDKVNFLAVDLDTKEGKGTISDYRHRMNLGEIDFAVGNNNILRDYNVVYTTTKYMIGKGGVILNKGTGEVSENTWHQVFQSVAQ